MSRWSSTSESLAGERAIRHSVLCNGRSIAYADVIRLWSTDDCFCSFFSNLLASAPFDAFRWETPSVSTASAQQPFEFALIHTPSLMRSPDPAAFGSYFRLDSDGDGVVTFANLGKDAVLVVPCPVGAESDYAHLASFLRTAAPQSVRALWRNVGDAMQARLDHRPVWLSTAGMGVAWLHVRLDDRPKYYAFDAYRAGDRARGRE